MTDTARLLREMADELEEAISHEADLHYANIIFDPQFSGQTPAEKFGKMYASHRLDMIARARAEADRLEGEEPQTASEEMEAD